jgi:serine/threonine protein kinase
MNPAVDCHSSQRSQGPDMDQKRASESLYLEKLGVCVEIASALAYLHSKCVIFRDLKPNNIGFLNGRVQLFDFGLSRELPSLNLEEPFEMSGKVVSVERNVARIPSIADCLSISSSLIRAGNTAVYGCRGCFAPSVQCISRRLLLGHGLLRDIHDGEAVQWMDTRHARQLGLWSRGTTRAQCFARRSSPNTRSQLEPIRLSPAHDARRGAEDEAAGRAAADCSVCSGESVCQTRLHSGS